MRAKWWRGRGGLSNLQMTACVHSERMIVGTSRSELRGVSSSAYKNCERSQNGGIMGYGFHTVRAIL
jgi:hypothetical protein